MENIKPQVAVLMTVYNRKAVTQHCLEKLYESYSLNRDRLDMKVYLVDDASTDGTKEMIKKEFPQVHLIEGDGQLFWNRGMRLAWEHAAKLDYDYYLWLNDDTIIYDSAVIQMLDAYRDNEGAVIVGATHATNNRNQTTYGGTNKDGVLLNPNGSYQRLSMINGNFVLVSRKVFNICGNLPYQLHHSGGDNFYALVTRKNGIPCILMPDYVGTCDLHEKPTPWTDPDVPIRKRFKSLYFPDNFAKHAWFLRKYDRGVSGAIIDIVRLHLYALCPSLVKKVLKATR